MTLLKVGHPINTKTCSVWFATAVFGSACEERVNDEMRAILLTRWSCVSKANVTLCVAHPTG